MRHAGFTLLEVLVALTILSTVALLAVRVSGDSQVQLAGTGWQDEVLRAGRGTLILLLREDAKNLEQWGTLAPKFPSVEWRSKRVPLQCMEGSRLEFRLVDTQNSREMLLECVLPK